MKQMSKKKLLSIILPLGLIIVIGGILGVYFYLKLGSGVNNWNEFKDDFYGYSIKYPKSWFVYPDEIHKAGYSTEITSYDLSKGQTIPSGGLRINIAMDNIGDSKSLDEWIKKNLPPVGNVVSQDNRVIAGVNSIVQTTSELGLLVYIPKDNQIFIIQAEPMESLRERYNETFNMILSTFKFTK